MTAIQPVMCSDAGPTLKGIQWVDLHSLYKVHRRQVLNECWSAPAIVVEEIHVRYILTCLLGSFLNYIRDFASEQSLIIS